MPDLLDEYEVAAMFNVAVSTVRNWRRDRKGPPYMRLGHKLVRYDKQELAAWIVAHRQNPTTADKGQPVVQLAA